MSKKTIFGIAGAVVLAILIVGVVLFMRGTEKELEVDNTQNTAISDTAKELDGYIEGMDAEEIDEVLNKEPTDVQKDAFQHVMDEITIPDIGSEITVDEEGTAHYIDTAGNEVEVAADQDLINKTDEELEDDYEEMMKALKEYQNVLNTNNSGNSNNTTNNNQGNTGNSLAGNNSVGNGDIDINDDISSEEYAEIERQIREQFQQNGGTIITDQRDSTISDSEREYIGEHLKPVN